MVASNDQALVRRCLEGDRHAFELLVERYQTPLYNVAFRMLGNEPDAEDVTQTVFVKAYEKLDQYNPRFKFFSWVYRMTVNEALNFSKRRKRLETMSLSQIAFGKTPFDHLTARDLEERVGAAMMYLSPEDRAIVSLKHFEHFPYKDIAFILEIPVKTVKSRLYTARQRLKDILVRKGFVENNG